MQSGVIAWPTWEVWGAGITGDPVAVSWANGRLDVFATDTARRLRHWWFDRLQGHTARQGPEIIGTTTFAGPLGATAWLPGRIDITGVDTNGAMRHSYVERPNPFSAWEQLGGAFA